MKDTYALGIHVGHDSGAAIVGKGGKIVAAVAEERFTRIKHYNMLPLNAINFCLKKAGVDIREVAVIAFPRLLPGAMEKILTRSWPKVKTDFGSGLGKVRLVERLGAYILFHPRLQRLLKIPATNTREPLYISLPTPSGPIKMMRVDHHLAHASAAYYTSGFSSKTLIVTVDGIGDGVSTAVWLGEDGTIKPIYGAGVEGSLGWFYGSVTEALGWWHGDGEGKTMGLAPYGKDERCLEAVKPFSPVYSGGVLTRPRHYGQNWRWDEAAAYHYHMEEANQIAQLVEQYGKENIAAAAQAILEEQLIDIVSSWAQKESVHSVAVAGGVFLNVKANQRIRSSLQGRPFYIYPDAGDSGLAAGAAIYAYYKETGQRETTGIDNIYFGPQFGNEEIEPILHQRNLNFKCCDNISQVCAEHLARGEIVGWVQGRMEVGPRALGNRSILTDPRKSENKDIVNAKVKFREAFRPFCPSLLEEAAGTYLKDSEKAPYMIISFDTKDERKLDIPAVVHVDGTVRPQTVNKEQNEKFYQLITEFDKLTSVPVILNTSFNLRGDPIIGTPRDAIRCFYDSGMDCLALGDFFLEK